MRISLLLALGFAALVSCSCTSVPDALPTQGVVQPEEFRVYEAMLGSTGSSPDNWLIGPDIGREVFLIVVEDMTRACGQNFTEDGTSARLAAATQEKKWMDLMPEARPMWRRYIQVNRERFRLHNGFDFENAFYTRARVDLRLMSREDADRLFMPVRDLDVAWREFYLKYPSSRGIVTFSRVAFDDECKTALAYGSISRNRSSGGGGLFLLRKESGRWKVVKWMCDWIS